MNDISFWFKLIGFTIVGIPIVIIIIVMIRVIKKSTQKPDANTVKQQRSQMFAKIKQKQASLIPWQANLIGKISNKTDYSFVKGIYQKFNGYILSSNSERLIAFRRIDHGLSIDTKITAATSDQIFYFVTDSEETLIYINGKALGRLKTNGRILNKTDVEIGQINRNATAAPVYNLIMNGTELALIVKNTDRRSFVKNPFHDIHSISGIEKAAIWQKDPNFLNSMVHPIREGTALENDWILALTILELVTFGIDFTRT
jgi:hypothetical protein